MVSAIPKVDYQFSNDAIEGLAAGPSGTLPVAKEAKPILLSRCHRFCQGSILFAAIILSCGCALKAQCFQDRWHEVLSGKKITRIESESLISQAAVAIPVEPLANDERT